MIGTKSGGGGSLGNLKAIASLTEGDLGF